MHRTHNISHITCSPYSLECKKLMLLYSPTQKGFIWGISSSPVTWAFVPAFLDPHYGGLPWSSVPREPNYDCVHFLSFFLVAYSNKSRAVARKPREAEPCKFRYVKLVWTSFGRYSDGQRKLAFSTTTFSFDTTSPANSDEYRQSAHTSLRPISPETTDRAWAIGLYTSLPKLSQNKNAAFYHDILRTARYCHGKSSVYLYVCQSVLCRRIGLVI